MNSSKNASLTFQCVSGRILTINQLILTQNLTVYFLKNSLNAFLLLVTFVEHTIISLCDIYCKCVLNAGKGFDFCDPIQSNLATVPDSFVGTVVPLFPSMLEKKTGKKHDSFIACMIRTTCNATATLGRENIHMIEQLHKNLSLSVPTNIITCMTRAVGQNTFWCLLPIFRQSLRPRLRIFFISKICPLSI